MNTLCVGLRVQGFGFPLRREGAGFEVLLGFSEVPTRRVRAFKALQRNYAACLDGDASCEKEGLVMGWGREEERGTRRLLFGRRGRRTATSLAVRRPIFEHSRSGQSVVIVIAPQSPKQKAQSPKP